MEHDGRGGFGLAQTGTGRHWWPHCIAVQLRTVGARAPAPVCPRPLRCDTEGEVLVVLLQVFSQQGVPIDGVRLVVDPPLDVFAELDMGRGGDE